METVCIFASDDEGEAETIRDVLEEHDIPTLVKNLYTQNLFSGIKMYTGRDVLAGSIQVFVREDDLERGLAVLQGEGIAPVEPTPQAAEPPSEPRGDSPDERRIEERRLVYLCTTLTLVSFLILPYLVNLPLLFRLARLRQGLFVMLLALGTVLAVGGLVFFLSR
jgi:hypothetical protein